MTNALKQARDALDRLAGTFYYPETNWPDYVRKAIAAADAALDAQPLTDEQAEALIDNSDGRWHDAEFRIDGPDLMRLLRAAKGAVK